MAWLLALALGAAQALWLFPLDFMLPTGPAASPALGDGAQHIIGQRYFIRDDWRWPLLNAENINTPDGLNIAFVDAIPIVALVLKVLAPLLPAEFHGIGLWYGLCVLLQPVAAVWALRGAGESRFWPSVAVALTAAGMPAWLGRFGHAALMGHFLILLGLGCYLRLMRAPQSRGLWLMAALLQVTALLAHPYLAVMTLALLAAVPLSLLLRRDAAWLFASLGTAAALVAVLGAMMLLGYLGASGGSDYGRYALNLLSPIWPAGSWLLGAAAPTPTDATGYGGWEGFNFLGFGILGGFAILLLTRPHLLLAVVRRHGGLLAALAILTAIAVTHRVGLGDRIILDLGPVPGLLEQFRASGRFFWPVGYVLAVGAVALIAGGLPRHVGVVLAVLLGIVQFADATARMQGLRHAARQSSAWAVDVASLRPLLAEHRRLTLLPSWFCVPSSDVTVEAEHRRLLDLLYLASETGLPASTMYVARWYTPPRCYDTARASARLSEGELRLLLPSAQPGLLPLIPSHDAHCRPVGDLVACSDPRATDSVPIPELEIGTYHFRTGGNGAPLLASGFSQQETWATWTEARRVAILARREGEAAAPLRLDLTLMGFGPRRGVPQAVEVRLDGRRIARWELPDGQPVSRRLVLPAVNAPVELRLEFRISEPTRPRDRDGGTDDRRLGFAIMALEVARH